MKKHIIQHIKNNIIFYLILGGIYKLIITSISILGILSIFTPIQHSSAQTSYIINASAGSPASITPSGAIEVPEGGTQTFSFGADMGAGISSLLVDKLPVSPIPLEYSFKEIQENHTIMVQGTKLPKITNKIIDCPGRDSLPSKKGSYFTPQLILTLDTPITQLDTNGRTISQGKIVNNIDPMNISYQDTTVTINLGDIGNGTRTLNWPIKFSINNIVSPNALSTEFTLDCSTSTNTTTHTITINIMNPSGTTDPQGEEKTAAEGAAKEATKEIITLLLDTSTTKTATLETIERGTTSNAATRETIERGTASNAATPLGTVNALSTRYLTVDDKSSQTIRILPDVGYAVDYVTIDPDTSNTIILGTPSITFNNITADITLNIYFKKTATEPSKPSGGGGGGTSLNRDYCPNGDYSASYYDGSCGTQPISATSDSKQNIEQNEKIDEQCTNPEYLSNNIAQCLGLAEKANMLKALNDRWIQQFAFISQSVASKPQTNTFSLTQTLQTIATSLSTLNKKLQNLFK